MITSIHFIHFCCCFFYLMRQVVVFPVAGEERGHLYTLAEFPGTSLIPSEITSVSSLNTEFNFEKILPVSIFPRCTSFGIRFVFSSVFIYRLFSFHIHLFYSYSSPISVYFAALRIIILSISISTLDFFVPSSIFPSVFRIFL